MNEKKKITINVIATYARSVLSVFIGLLSTKWLLEALGKNDYGLFGLVGGLTVFISFINTLMSTAVSRFYAVAEGERQAGFPGAEKRISEWFNTALFIHVLLPTVLLIIGYPIGAYAIRHWLTIPDNRITQCVWVFRFTCIACYAGMVVVPFSAMFIAKQRIAEYTLYIMIGPIINIMYIYHMLSYKSEWLVRYAIATSCVTIGIQILIGIRSYQIFSECRITKKFFFDKKRLKELTSFAGWQCFGSLGSLIRVQGMAILGNVNYGSEVNASLTIANKVSAQTEFLSAGLKTAFSPAITNAYGAKEINKMKQYTMETNRIGALLILLLAVPLSLEIDKIFTLWLKTPPVFSKELCLFIMASLVVDKTTSGHMLAVSATGRIALYQSVLGSLLILALPLAWIMIRIGLGIMSIGYAIFITTVLCAWGRVYFAYRILNLPMMLWVRKVLFPVGLVASFSLLLSFMPHLIMQESIKRLILTICLSDACLIILSWCFVLDVKEKDFLMEKINSLIKKTMRLHRTS